MYARHNAGTCSDPYIISDHDLSASEHITVFQIMVIRDNGHMRTDLYVISDRDPSDRHDCEVMVDEDMFAESDLFWKIDLYRHEDACSFRYMTVKQFIEGCFPFL